MSKISNTLKLSSFALFICAGLAPLSANAQNLEYAGLSAGTLGVGAEIGYRVHPNILVRGIANGFSYSRTIEADNENDGVLHYDGKLKFGTFGAQADFGKADFPLYASVGIFANSNKIDLKMTGSDLARLLDADVVYKVDSVEGGMKFNSASPYLGVGAKANFGGFQIALDAGALFQGAPQVTLKPTGADATNQVVVDGVEVYRQDLITATKDYKVWPVVALKLRRKF